MFAGLKQKIKPLFGEEGKQYQYTSVGALERISNCTKFVLIYIFKTGNDIGQKIANHFLETRGKLIHLYRCSCNKLHRTCFNLHF